MTGIGKLWCGIAEIFSNWERNFKGSQVTLECSKKDLNAMVQLGCLHEIAWYELCSIVNKDIAPKFWKHFELDLEWSDTLNNEISETCSLIEIDFLWKFFHKFSKAIEELQSNYLIAKNLLQHLQLLTEYSGSIDDGQRYNISKFQQVLREALLANLPLHFSRFVYVFYKISFRVFANVAENSMEYLGVNSTTVNDITCGGCNLDTEKCRCQYLITVINQINAGLISLELLDRIAGQAITLLVQKRIKEYISETCHGIFDRSHLKQLEMWLENVVINWLTHVLDCGNRNMENSDLKSSKVIANFKVKLTYYLYESFARSVIEQFFGIIIDFPDSIPAIDDLKICMEKIDMRKYLIKSLKNSLEARTLHPGVNTIDILTGYVAAIKAIRHMDSSGVILETVTAPIKGYLRKRRDTVRRVVTGLTEEGPTDLSEELAKGEAFKENIHSAISDELSNWENWLPDPLGLEDNTNRAYCLKMSRSTDIISMVVDIYGSKELFMNEYRNLMADRLLTQLDFSPEKEIRNLELLKLRFGETLLHSCEVMLKDIADSKRINIHIHSDIKNRDSRKFEISSLIISAQFWPSFNKETLELPEEIANEFKKYTQSFEAYKGNRTLNWRHVTGRVNIIIELGPRVFEMTVPPTQAVIMYHFQHKSEWTLEALSTLVKVPPSILRRRIGYWQTYGIISEERAGVFKLNEEGVEKCQCEVKQAIPHVTDDEDVESAMASVSDQREEELQVFWSYIVGMLTNLDSLPIERIHQMLRLFASHGLGVDFSQNELKDFLQRKVREHKLVFSGGVYQLAK